MNIWSPETEDDFDRILDHSARHGMSDDELIELADWLRDRGNELTIKDGRPSGWLFVGERYTHRDVNKRRQYVFVFRKATAIVTDTSIEILFVHNSSEQWTFDIQNRQR